MAGPKFIWREEFDVNSLDTTSWAFENENGTEFGISGAITLLLSCMA